MGKGKGKETVLLHKRKKQRGREGSSSFHQNSVAKPFKSSSPSTDDEAIIIKSKSKSKSKSSSSTQKAAYNKAGGYHHHRSEANNVANDDDEKTDGSYGSPRASDENYMVGLGVFEFPWLKEVGGGLVCNTTDQEDERWWCSDSEWCMPDMAAAGWGFAFAADKFEFEETASAWSSILEMEAAAATTSNGPQINHHQ